MLHLIEKAFQSAIMNIFKELNEIPSKDSKETVGTMYHEIQNIKKEIEITKRTK